MNDLPAGWRDLIPHRPPMCLLDSIEQWSETRIMCTAVSHRRIDHPLRTEQGLHVVHTVEYAAQAIAVHVALRRRQQDPPLVGGVLAAVHAVRLAEVWLHTVQEPLMIRADLLAGTARQAMYQVAVQAGRETILDGRVTVALEVSDLDRSTCDSGGATKR